MTAAQPPIRAATLAALCEGIAAVPPAFDRVVRGLSAESRTTRPGDLFCARRGLRVRGEDFIADAVRAGAVAAIREGESPPASAVDPGRRSRVVLGPEGVPVVTVAALGTTLGVVASRFHGHPAEALRVVGVTGTNGKTSVSHFIADALHGSEQVAEGELRCGLVGTLGHGFPGALELGGLTTPDAVTTHRLLAELRARGARRAVMEVSSHALVQGRVAGVRFDTAVFTNLTRDHLDYHGDMRSYGAAKRGLFLSEGLRAAVVNVDDPFGRELLEQLPGQLEVLAYRLEDADHADGSTLPGAHARGAALLRGRVTRLSGSGLTVLVDSPWGRGELDSALLGRFNASNLLAALAVLLLGGMPWEVALERLTQARPPPGRLECFGGGALPLVAVDYAHTPDALARVLQTLRAHCGGRLWCVFGCGGERDRGKRPLMGAAAAADADVVVLTDDNPRNEDGARIVDEIREGMRTGANVRVERDRARAIHDAVAQAAAGDVVLIAGKGHEPYQERGGRRRPFSDAAEVRAALCTRAAGGLHQERGA